MPAISRLEISAVACLTLQGASTCLADLRDLLHTQHLASAGGSVSPAALRRTPCKPSGAKRLRAQCEVRQVLVATHAGCRAKTDRNAGLHQSAISSPDARTSCPSPVAL